MTTLSYNSGNVNIVFDGHSQVAGAMVGTSDRPGDQLMRIAPINGALTYSMLGANGDTFAGMISGSHGSGADQVRAAYQPTMQNILLVWEAHNSAATTRPDGSACTVQNIIDDCKAYLQAVGSTGQKWRVLLLTELAFMDDDPTSPINAVMDGWNAWLRANWQTMTQYGVEGVVDTRPPGGQLAYTPPYTYTDMYGSEGRWIKSGLFADYVHLNAAGYAIIAQYIANVLTNLPATAPPAVVQNSLPAKPAHGRTGVLLGRM